MVKGFRKKSSTVLLLEDWATVNEGANLRKPFKVTKMKKISGAGRCTLRKSITSRRKMHTETLCGSSRYTGSTFGWGLELDPKTGQSVLTYLTDHVWIKTSQNPSQPLQKVAVRKKQSQSPNHQLSTPLQSPCRQQK